ncbi:MAG: class I SAM-dependent methyltransferase, partial [Planctomycetota bacterium]
AGRKDGYRKRSAGPHYPDSREGKGQEEMILAEHAKNVTSQRGEDGIIEKVFDVIGTKNKVCVDIGAGDGDRTSNTWNLLNFCGWSGVLFEPKESAFKSLENRYLHRSEVRTYQHKVGFSADDRLDTILPKTSPVNFDLLSIDIDGCD